MTIRPGRSNNETGGVGSETSRFDQLLARYERIIEIGQQLNSTRNHVDLLRRIISAAMELIDTETASILLMDAATGELRFELAANMDQEMSNIVVPMDGSIAGWVVTHGEPRVIADVSQEPSFFRNVDDILDFHTSNVLAVPLRTHQKVIGALEAVNKRDGAPFNGEDVRVLMTLAGQAAIAIENARLFQQSDFMAEMVHELRTPLASLRTSTVLLQRGTLDDEQHEILSIMQNETERLIHMTSDFLDLARLESGRMRLDHDRFEVDKLAHECINVVQAQAQDRGVTITTELEALIAEGDRGKIKQVLLNLLTNAIKYNRENGGIHVKTTTSFRHDQPSVEFSVADTGNGISREDQQSLFQKFFRVAETAGTVQGTGLGLAISKYIVEAHGGSIWIESEPGVGSTFYFTVPTAS